MALSEKEAEAAHLINRVIPNYPLAARSQHIEGIVKVRAIIARDGTIRWAHAVSGDPTLTDAAVNAVKEWRYLPHLFNGQPIEVDTVVEVLFPNPN